MQKGSVYFLILRAAEGCQLTSVAGNTATVVFSINLSTVMVAYDTMSCCVMCCLSFDCVVVSKRYCKEMVSALKRILLCSCPIGGANFSHTASHAAASTETDLSTREKSG